MKILFVIDCKKWAIDTLAQSVTKFNKHHQIEFIYVPPRDASVPKVIEDVSKKVNKFKPDLIQYEYFRTAAQLIEHLPELKTYKSCLMHHNVRDKALLYGNWQKNKALEDKPCYEIDQIMCHTNEARQIMEDKGVADSVKVIRYGIDQNFFTWSDQEPKNKAVGYAGRIVIWKNLKEVAQACRELNYDLQMMGRQSDKGYFAKVPKHRLKFDYFNCGDKDRINFYRSLTCFVNNSGPGYEEGPLPVLEAWACGVPVITTPTGQAGILEGYARHESNCLLVPCNDYKALRLAINRLMKDGKLRKSLRLGGFEVVKHMLEEKMAREYEKVWYSVVHPENKLVSVIIPATYDRVEQVDKILEALNNQTYLNIEAVVIWDESIKSFEFYTDPEAQAWYNFPIKELHTLKEGYNLAMARNLGVIESAGEILIFNDSRLCPDEDAVMNFVHAVENAGAINEGGQKKVWFNGNKGSTKRAFVENWSAVRRDFCVSFGLFLERITKYGAMTQEVRTRWVKQGGKFYYLENAKCKEIKSASKSLEKRNEIKDSKLLLYKMYGSERY